MLRRNAKLRKFVGDDQRELSQSVMGVHPTTKSASDDVGLESAVFGGEGELVQKLDEFVARKIKRKRNAKESERSLQPVWVDDDPTIEQSPCKKITKSVESWARLPCQRSDAESEADSDKEDGVDDATGNCLAPVSKLTSLPSGLLHVKKRKNANADRPAKGKLQSVEFHPEAQVMLTAGVDQTLRLFQIDGQNNPCIQSVYMDMFPIHCAHFSHDGHEVILGSRHTSFYYYDMIAGQVVNVPRIKALDGCAMQQFVVSPDGKYLAFFGRYGNIHLLTAQSKEWVGSLKMNGDVEAVAFSADGNKMFSHGAGNEVYVWDVRQKSCCHKFVDDGCAVRGTSISISPGDQYLATGSDSGVVNVYDMTTCMRSKAPKPLKAVQNLTTACTSCKFNATAEILATASDRLDKSLKLIHLPSLTVFSNFPNQSDIIRIPTCLDWSVHSGYLAVGNQKGQALLYRLKHYSNY